MVISRIFESYSLTYEAYRLYICISYMRERLIGVLHVLDPRAAVEEATRRRGLCGIERSRPRFVTAAGASHRSDICEECLVGLMRWHWSEMMLLMDRLNRGSATLRDLMSTELDDGLAVQNALLAKRFAALFSARD